MIRKIGELFLALLFIVIVLFTSSPQVFALSDAQKKTLDSGIYYFNTEVDVNCGGSITLIGSDNAQKAYNFFFGKGLTPIQAVGIMGNLQAESSIIPDREEAGGGGGYGIAQWTGGRRTALEQAAATKGANVKDLGFQLQYLIEEAQQRGNLDGLRQQTDVQTATWYWEDNFEAPLVSHQQVRVDFANDFLAQYGSGTGGGLASGGGNSCGGSLVTGDVKNLAQQMLDNTNISYDGGRNSEVPQQLQGLTQGIDPGKCGMPVSGTLLGYILGLAQNHKLQISSLVRPGDACGSPHAMGCAVDIDYFDEQVLTGSNKKSLELIKDALTIFPSAQKLGFGTGTGLSLGQIGTTNPPVTVFPDNPNHVHTDLRCWQK